MLLNRVLLAVSFCGVLVAGAGSAPARVKTVVRAASASGDVSQYLVALPHLAFGGSWRTKIIITNTNTTPSEIVLQYYGSNGSPASLPFNGVLSDHTDVVLPGLGQREVEPDWSGAETSAWAGLVFSDAGLKVQGVFLWHNSADPADKYTEAAVPVALQGGTGCAIPLPSVSGASMPFDQTEGRFSGYAFANTNSTPVLMTVTFHDVDGAVLGTYTEQLPGFGHTQFLLSDKVPAVAGNKGLMQLSGDGVVPLGFRFTKYYTFTTWQP